jgi:hypothetical protein
MKTALTVLFVLFFIFILVNRERIYIRDPIARVYRNNVKQTDMEVFINYSTDVLLQQGDATSRTLIQAWDHVPGTPLTLTCMRWLACMTSEDHAPTLPIRGTGPGTYDPKVLMTNREVSYVAADGALMLIEIR